MKPAFDHREAIRRDAVLQTVLPYVRGKRVLDIGCVEHSTSYIDRDRVWVHAVLCEAAQSCIGIDIVDSEISVLRERGYDVHVQNAEDFEFSEKFDVIFAGEIIEHLSNAGKFLDRCKEHLTLDGRLILTTPNAFNFYELSKVVLRYTNDPWVIDEHTCWYSPMVIKSLLSRHGFGLSELKFVDYPHIKPRLVHRLAEFATNVLGDKFKTTMIIIAQPSK